MTIQTSKSFNTTGPCRPSEHYILPVLPRLPGVMEMIEGKYYFVIHAPRQSGKTTFLHALVDDINKLGRMYALYCTLEFLQGLKSVEAALLTIPSQILLAMKRSGVEVLKQFASGYRPDPEPRYDAALIDLLTSLSASLDKELVVLIDEADCLAADPLIHFLRQIRIGYNDRDRSPDSRFPSSLALIGMRDIRDYLTQVRPESESMGVASPFNVKKKSLTMANFTRGELEALYGQHTEATRQVFEPSAIERAWYWSEGQPWLVNALADLVVSEILINTPSKPVTGEYMDQAAEILIRRQDTHLDSLLNRLREPRVRSVVQPILLGDDTLPVGLQQIDRRYVLDLGLIKDDGSGYLAAANPIYQEVIIRFLADTYESQFNKSLDLARRNRWVDGESLDMTSLIKAFQEFWRENSGTLKDPNDYDEALALLVLNAFFQRLLNGGVELLRREYALGRQRLDIIAQYKGVAYPVEVKIRHHQGLEASLEQIRKYMDGCGAREGWLVIFDRKSKKSWEAKISWETREVDGAIIHLVGC
jgi:hypothetical protein